MDVRTKLPSKPNSIKSERDKQVKRRNCPIKHRRKSVNVTINRVDGYYTLRRNNFVGPISHNSDKLLIEIRIKCLQWIVVDNEINCCRRSSCMNTPRHMHT